VRTGFEWIVEDDRVNPPGALAEIESKQRDARLTVIIVNYNSWPDVVRLVRSLAAEPEFRSGHCHVVVVDNASREAIPVELMGLEAGVRVVARAVNGGFAAGVNAGRRVARSPWLLVLNPDVEIESGFVGQVFARLEFHETNRDGPPGIVGFRLRNLDGSPQGSVGVFPSLARSIREQFLPRSRRKYQPGWRIRSGSVDWVTGACMLISTRTIDSLGGMDEDFFLYHEEVAFCLLAHGQGCRVEYDASVSAIHRQPLQNRAISPMMRVITRHSKLLYFRKHLPRWEFVGLAAIIAVEAAMQERWNRVCRRDRGARAWRTIGQIARRLRRGELVRGPEVLALVESLESAQPGRDSDPSGKAATRTEQAFSAPISPFLRARMLRGPRDLRARSLGPRKDGSV
jgi:GT2 family glycosyltransferase